MSDKADASPKRELSATGGNGRKTKKGKKGKTENLKEAVGTSAHSMELRPRPDRPVTHPVEEDCAEKSVAIHPSKDLARMKAKRSGNFSQDSDTTPESSPERDKRKKGSSVRSMQAGMRSHLSVEEGDTSGRSDPHADDPGNRMKEVDVSAASTRNGGSRK